MLRQFTALCLLALALSPCTAPFAVIDIADRPRLIAPLESLSTLRQIHNPRVVTALRSAECCPPSVDMTLTPPLTALDVRYFSGSRAWPALHSHESGSHSVSTTVLRL